VNFPSRLNDYGYEYGYYYHYAYANEGGKSSIYGKYGQALGTYARGVGNLLRGSSAAVQRYHDQGVSSELRQSNLKSGNAANQVNGKEPSDHANPPKG
jgi:hypothetical protein